MRFKKATSILLIFAILISVIAPTGLINSVSANQFTITFDMNGGEGVGPTPVQTNANGTVPLPGASSVAANVTRSGHTLPPQGPIWFRDADGVNPWTAQDVATQNMTLFARWIPLHTISFHMGEALVDPPPRPANWATHGRVHANQVPHGSTLTIGDITGTQNAPRASGLWFDGWFDDAEYTIRRGPSTITGITAGPNNPITGPITLHARWLPANNVVFNLNYENYPLDEGEEAKNNPPTAEVRDNTVIPQHMRPLTTAAAETNRTAAGWVFAGWFTEPNLTGYTGAALASVRWDLANRIVPPPGTSPNENGTVNLYAHWTRLRFDLNYPNAPAPPVPNVTPEGLLQQPSAPVRPNETPCKYWNTGCETHAPCAEAVPAPAARHGNEWSFGGWFRNPNGEGSPWVFSGAAADRLVVGDNVTLYPHWIRSYAVDYFVNPANDTTLEITNPNSLIPFRYVTIPLTGNPNVTVPGITARRHIFNGWFKEPALTNMWVSADNASLTEDISLYGKWTPANIVTFDSNHNHEQESPSNHLQQRFVPVNGTGMNLFNTTAGSPASSASTPPAPTSRGQLFDFIGWYHVKNPNFNIDQPWDRDQIVTGDMTLYAAWGERVAVTFHSEPARPMFASPPWPQGQSVPIGNKINDPTNASMINRTIDGFTIVGWCIHPNCQLPLSQCSWDFSKNLTMEDLGTPVPSPLAFRLYVKVVPALQVEYDLNYPGEAPGTRWLTTPSAPFNQIVTQLSAPGSRMSSPQIVPQQLFPPTTQGNPLPWQFVGWYTTPAAANSLSTTDAVDVDESGRFVFSATGTLVNRDTILYAGWRSGFSVTFNANLPAGMTAEVNVPFPIFVQPNATVPQAQRPVNPPILEGYEFKGWFTTPAGTAGSEVNWNTPITGNVNLHAKWVQTRLISFNLNYPDAGRNPDDVIIAVGDRVTNPVLPVREGWNLVGWYRTPQAANTLDASQRWDFVADTVTTQMTLFAGWIEVFEVSFDPNFTTTVTPPSTQRINRGGQIIRPAPPIRAGHTFIGWYRVPNIDFDTMTPWIYHQDVVTANTVLYAGYVQGQILNPLMMRLDEIMQASTANNGATINVDMGTFTTMPSVVLSVIRGRNINLNLNMGGYTLNISGSGITTTADRDFDLVVNISYDSRILTNMPQTAIDEFAIDKENNNLVRPVWQIIISNDVNAIARAITINPPVLHRHPGKYGILISHIANNFVDRANAQITTTGSLSLQLSLGEVLTNNEFIILINDKASSAVAVNNCETCKNSVLACICIDLCGTCNQNPCICVACGNCGSAPCVCVDTCTTCHQTPCICVACLNCGLFGTACVCNQPNDCTSCTGWTVAAPSTCTTAGTRTRACSDPACIQPKSESIPPSGHNFGEFTSLLPTCTVAGTRSRTCARCNFTETETLDALTHLMGTFVINTDATCVVNGSRSQSCTRTGCSHSVSEVITAPGHNFGAFILEVTPTPTSTGLERANCLNLGCSHSITQTLPMQCWTCKSATCPGNCGTPSCANNHTLRTNEDCTVCLTCGQTGLARTCAAANPCGNPAHAIACQHNNRKPEDCTSCADCTVTELSRTCTTPACGNPAHNPLETTFKAGFIRNNGTADRVTIGDVLELLKFLAKIKDNELDKNGGATSQSWQNSLLTQTSINNNRPGIGDALEILKHLAKITPNLVDNPIARPVK
jgi:hypothetical protein